MCKILARRGNILIIHHNYGSVSSPNAFRWQSVAEYWVRQGCKIHVVSAWQPGLQREEVVNGVHVYRAGGVFIEKMRVRTLKAHQSVTTNNINIKQRCLRFLKWLHDRTWKKIYWPDYACLWFLPALKRANRVMEELNIEHLVSVSIPFTAHLVGSALKRRHPGIRWVVDVIDPFCFLKSTGANNYSLYAGLNKLVEKRIFRNAVAVSVLTEQIRKKYGELFPESAKKIFVNPNLLSPIDGKEVCARRTPLFGEGKMYLAFIGSLNKKVRTPENLLKVFEMLSEAKTGKVEMHFFGGINDCWDQVMQYKHLIGNSIFVHGVVSQEEAIHAMDSADILVNIGNSNPYQEPSKLLEYVRAGKPIINIATVANDTSAMLLETYPMACTVLTPITEENAYQIDDLVEFITNPLAVDEDFIKEWLAPFTIESISSLYAKMLFR